MPHTQQPFLIHRDTEFINVIYGMQVATLVRMDKGQLSRFLARTRLVCKWLEGVLKLADMLATLETPEQKGE